MAFAVESWRYLIVVLKKLAAICHCEIIIVQIKALLISIIHCLIFVCKKAKSMKDMIVWPLLLKSSTFRKRRRKKTVPAHVIGSRLMFLTILVPKKKLPPQTWDK